MNETGYRFIHPAADSNFVSAQILDHGRRIGKRLIPPPSVAGLLDMDVSVDLPSLRVREFV